MLIAGLVGQKSGTSWADGRYVVQNAVGNGAFGTVWRAVDGTSGETCAIKRVVLDDRYQNREVRPLPLRIADSCLADRPAPPFPRARTPLIMRCAVVSDAGAGAPEHCAAARPFCHQGGLADFTSPRNGLYALHAARRPSALCAAPRAGAHPDAQGLHVAAGAGSCPPARARLRAPGPQARQRALLPVEARRRGASCMEGSSHHAPSPF